LPVCGLQIAYYQIESVDNANHPGAKAALHLVNGGSGFANFRNALTNNGYTLDQVEMSFTAMTLGNDVSPNDWFVSGDTETRQYRGGTFTFTLDGEDMLTGPMPALRIIIDYNEFHLCLDDVITGQTMASDINDASQNSSAAVQAVAAAFLQDLGNRSFYVDFEGLQPAAQGQFGATFEAQTGTITLSTVHDQVFQSTNIAPGNLNNCQLANESVTSTGSGNWLHIEHQNDLVCSILDTENMGLIEASIYINSNNVREQRMASNTSIGILRLP